MRKSIRIQFVSIVIGMLAGTLILCWIINTAFLDKYYIMNKNEIVQGAYEKINAAGEDGTLQTEEFQEQMKDYAFRYNANMIVINSNSEIVLLATFDDKELNTRLLGYIMHMGILEDMTGIEFMPPPNEVFQGMDMHGKEKRERIELYGQLDNGMWYIISSPMESIRDSVALSNRFLGYVGIMAIVFSAMITWIVGNRFTKPILELTEISKRMIHLDFEAKYKGKAANEIAALGRNMNALSDSLEHTISELKTANNELKKDIEKKEEIDEMRKEFLSNVSHELKTPIALIQGYAEGLRDGITDDPESVQYYLDVIVDEAEKMNLMVQKLLTLNQLESGADIVNMERFDIAELVRNYTQSADIMAKQNGIEVRVGAAEPLYVWGDPFKVEEVLMNYFTNAVNHCDGKKVIDIQVAELDGKVRVSVFNTGAPIPEESIPQIWDKFYKVDKARTREYGGSGVGLSIVKAIMCSMNQAFGVENYTNGVMFWFELDAVKEQQ